MKKPKSINMDDLMSYDEIAERLGLSRARVHQIYNSAIKKIIRNQPAMRILKDYQEEIEEISSKGY